MHPMLNTALEVARTTAEMIYKAYEKVDSIDVQAKGTNDYVTKVDQQPPHHGPAGSLPIMGSAVASLDSEADHEIVASSSL